MFEAEDGGGLYQDGASRFGKKDMDSVSRIS